MLATLRTFLNIVVTFIEFVLSIRFILVFFKIGSSASFTAWIYKITASLVAPFSGILAPLKIGSFSIDFTTLIAIIIYGIAGNLIIRLLSYISRG